MARIPYVKEEDLPKEYRYLLYTHLEKSVSDVDDYSTVTEQSGRGLRHTYQLFGHNPEILDYHRNYITTLWQEFDIPARERELVVLTTSRKIRSRYEWQHHVPVALDEGLTEAEIRAISNQDFSLFSDAETTLMEYTISFLDDAVDDEMHNRITMYYPDPEMLLGIVMVSGFYQWHALVMKTFDIDLEHEFIGWDLENL